MYWENIVIEVIIEVIKLKIKIKNYMYMIIYYNIKSDVVCYLIDLDRYVQYVLVMWQFLKNCYYFC